MVRIVKPRRKTIAFTATTLIVLGLFCSLVLYDYIYGNELLNIETHVTMRCYKHGELVSTSHHAGVLTTIGGDWIEDQLKTAVWIGLSNDGSSPSDAWTAIPNEIVTDGLERVAGSYADDGTGDWNITYSFNPTGTGSCQLTGLYYASTGSTLLASDTFTQVNYDTDTVIEITWQISVS